MKETQLLKGVLEGCVLQIISEREIYGYELVQHLKGAGFTSIIAGTVYPLLQKLEKKGLVTTRFKQSPDGPDRKYFDITEAGQVYLLDFWRQWDDLVNKVSQLK
ncbi:PadR family transcriptional regulator [Streptococcus ferus]|uniref:PadR family transcriptional regulator n=1 Tax=Streptococcus ferus TaxID=1345 RepID=UPI0035A08E19